MKTIKVIFTRGMQASGKSWWAKQFVKDNQTYKRINRDSLRTMLSNYTFNKENEKLVTIIEDTITEELISEGFNLIIDNMNLDKEKLDRRKNWIKEICNINDCEVEFEIKNFPIQLEEAITRDKLRADSLGEKVLRGTWNRYKNELIEMLEENKPEVKYNPDLPDAVCFDVDGTLARRNNRNPFDFTKVKEDIPVKIVFEQMKFHDSVGRKIFVFSGRDDSCFYETFEWIQKFFKEPFELFMRKTGDSRRDSKVKKEMYERHIKGKFNLIAVYDDRPQVLNECWRDLGIFTFDVGKGIEF